MAIARRTHTKSITVLFFTTKWRALQGYEKAWGPEHTSRLDTVKNLGNLYTDQGKMAEAEKMYVRALRGYEMTWGPEHMSTLGTVNNLANSRCEQRKPFEPEQMYQRVLEGFRRTCGEEHFNTVMVALRFAIQVLKSGIR